MAVGPRPILNRLVLVHVVAPLAATRAVLAVVGVLSISTLPLSPFAPMDWVRNGAGRLIDAFTRWDAQHYVRIASEGYTAADPSGAAFFPLLPTLMRVIGTVIGKTDLNTLEIIGVLIANISLFAAVVALFALVRLEFDVAIASRTVLYLLVFPTTLFLSAAYAESLFLALSIGSILASRRRRWAAAGLLGGFAALSRPFGAIVAVPLLLEAFDQRHERPWRAVAALAAIPAAVLAYMAFLQAQYGDPLAFLHVQSVWNRNLMPPWETIVLALSGPLTVHSGLHSSVDLAFTFVVVPLVVATWRLLRPSYAAYATAMALVPLSTGALLSVPRFAITWFPVFIVLAIVGRVPWVDRMLLVTCMGLASLFMALYAQWYWVS